jgi:hypothetical protein
MAAILPRPAMLNQRPLRRGCLIEFLYLTGIDLRARGRTCPAALGSPSSGVARQIGCRLVIGL